PSSDQPSVSASHTSAFTLSFDCYGDHRDLHSFPTRRSSDLGGRLLGMTDAASNAGSALEIDPDPKADLHRYLRSARDALLWKLEDRKSTRLNSSHVKISYAVFCLKKKKITQSQSGYRSFRSH